MGAPVYAGDSLIVHGNEGGFDIVIPVRVMGFAFMNAMGLAMIITGINLAVFYLLMADKIRSLSDDAPVPLSARLVALISLCCW